MKFKSLFLSLITLLCSVSSMHSMTTAKILLSNKKEKIKLIKEQFEKVFDHANACNKFKQKIRSYYDSLTYLNPKKIIKVCEWINNILNTPENTVQIEEPPNTGHIIWILDQAKKRKLKHNRTLKERCLNKLKNISIQRFNRLCFDLQRKLAEKTKRLDLAYACAKNTYITLPIAQLIVAQIDGALKIGRTQHLNRVLPTKILRHGNRKILARALLNQD